MASVDPKVIRDIRIRKQAQELLKKSNEVKAMGERLIELSGIKERGINPSDLNISDEHLPELLKAAYDALNAGELFAEDTVKTSTGTAPARTRRQLI
jgi:hypothetical protein